VSNRSSTIEQAVKAVAKLDYSTLSTVSNNSNSESSLLERIADSTPVPENFIDSTTYAFDPNLLTTSYDVSQDYGPTFTAKADLKELYESTTSSASDVQAMMMTPQELEEAVKDINWAQALGDTSQVSYVVRERVAFASRVDPVSTRLYHALNRVTDDVDYAKIY